MVPVEVLRTLANTSEQLGWEMWLPLATADPVELAARFDELTDDEKYAVLDHVRGGGPLADVVLDALARHAHLVLDEQVRAFLLADASEARARSVAALRALSADLSAQIGRQRAWQAEGVDVAAEVLALRGQLDELRVANLEAGHLELVTVESELARLRTLHERLRCYDKDARGRELAELRKETTALLEQREISERALAEALRACEAATAGARAAEEHLDRATAEVASAGARRDRAAAETERLTDDLQGWSAELAALEARAADARGRQSGLRDNLEAARGALRELDDSPLTRAAADVRAQVEALLAQVPADEAEPIFATTTTTEGRS